MRNFKVDIIKKYQKYLAAVGILVLGFLAYSKFNKKKEIVSEEAAEQNVSADQQKSTTDEAVSFDTQVEDQT